MKNRTWIIAFATLFLLGMICLVISCSGSDRNEGLTSVSVSLDNDSKGLTTKESSNLEQAKGLDDFSWTFTATPNANQLGFGATDEEVEFDDGSKSIQLSYGTWTFDVYGYEDDNHEALVYRGTRNQQIHGDSMKVTVNVDKLTEAPQGKSLAKAIVLICCNEQGKPDFELVYSDDEGEHVLSSDSKRISVVLYAIEDDERILPGSEISEPDYCMSFDPGLYELEVSYTDNQNNEGKLIQRLTLYAGQSYELSGTIELDSYASVRIRRGEVQY